MRHRPRNLISFLFIAIIMGSCSTAPTYPLKAKKYKNDLVSVQTAVNLAHSSYLKACVDQGQSFEKCRQKAKKYVKENIIFILDQ